MKKSKETKKILLDHHTTINLGLEPLSSASPELIKNSLSSPFNLESALSGINQRAGELIALGDLDQAQAAALIVLTEAIQDIQRDLQNIKTEVRSGKDFSNSPYDPQTAEWLWELDRIKAGGFPDAYNKLENLVDVAFRAGALARQVDLLSIIPQAVHAQKFYDGPKHKRSDVLDRAMEKALLDFVRVNGKRPSAKQLAEHIPTGRYIQEIDADDRDIYWQSPNGKDKTTNFKRFQERYTSLLKNYPEIKKLPKLKK